MKNTNSLKTKILVTIGVIIFAVLGASTFIHIQALRQDYLEAVQWRSESLAQEILGDIIRKYGIYKVPDVRRFLSALSLNCMQIYDLNKDKNVAHVAVIDESGTIAAHNSRELWNTPIQDPVLLRNLERRERITVSGETAYHTFVPIFLNQNVFLGTIDIGFPKTVMEQKIYSILTSSLKLLAVFLIIALLAASHMVHLLIIKPIRNLTAYLSRISRGAIPEKITEEYKGEFDEIRNSLNILIEATNQTVLAAEGIAAGNLSLEVRERSEHDRMMLALNRMIRRLNDIMNETEAMIQAVGEGRLDVRGNAALFQGGWRELVTGVNNLIDGLSSAVSEKAALGMEIELAKKIQTVLLPKNPLISGYEIAASMDPAEEVGGDYYDVISVNGYDWIVIGDVSGHGVTSGLVMMMVQTSIHTVLIQNPQTPPSHLLSVINRTIYENIVKMDEQKHMTILVIACGKDGFFDFSGLHEDILLRRAETRKVERIKTDGMWIGLEPDISKMLPANEFRLNNGDCLVLYTDGITEAWGKDGKMFGEERLIKIVESSGGKSAAEIHAAILNEIRDFEKPDDVTLFVMKRV